LKLDLHTHCSEATCVYTPNRDVVKKIVAAVKAKGLDGIGVTEHYNKNYGFQVREIVERHFNNEILIIPGQEIDKGKLHVVMLYLPGDLTFRFVGHPGYPKVEDFSTQIDDSIHGIEFRNPTHDDEMDQTAIRKAARKHNLLLLQNSDAHFLSDIGKYYNEITIEELCARAS
jgi:histidinol phosphatase-like PHP family hydrolase